MRRFEWTDDLSVGIEEFDNHHRHLVELINRLYESESTGQEKDVVGEVLTELSNYTLYHFFAEEDAMERHDFPGRHTHRSEHLRLANRVLGFLNDYGCGKADIAAELLDFLVGWWRHHMLKTDKQYGPFLIERGVS
jgi:hemerythrin